MSSADDPGRPAFRIADATPRLTSLLRDDRFLLPILYTIPVLLGFTLLFELADNPFFRLQLSDDAFYLQIARLWADGGGIGPIPLYFSPLYPAFLTLLAKLSITSVTAIRVVQILLGSLSYPIAFVLARRLFGRRAAFFTYVLALGYGVLLQGMTELVTGWLEVLLTLGIGLLLSGTLSLAACAAAGALTGLLCLGRPTFALFAAVTAACLALGRFLETSDSARKRLQRAAVFLACVAVPVIPVTIRNVVVGHDLVFVSTHGGINFFIGNSPGANGTFSAPPGFHEDLTSLNVTDAKNVAERLAGRPLSASQVSRFWFGKGLEFLADNPARGLKLYGRKILLLLHSYEVPSNSSYSTLEEGSGVLQALPVSFALLLVAAIVGVALSVARWEKLFFLYLMLALHLGSILIFFVASRFRLPLAGLLAVFAGHAFDAGLSAFSLRRGRLVAVAAASGLLVVLLSYPYPMIEEMRRDHAACSFDIMGAYYYDNDMDLAQAESLLQRAIAIQPSRKSAHWYLARILERRGDLPGATREWDRASFLYGPGSEWGRIAAGNRDRLQAAAPGAR